MTSAHVLAQSESASLRKAATDLGASGEEVPEADHLDTHTQKKNKKNNQKTIKQTHVCNLLSLSLHHFHYAIDGYMPIIRYEYNSTVLKNARICMYVC